MAASSSTRKFTCRVAFGHPYDCNDDDDKQEYATCMQRNLVLLQKLVHGQLVGGFCRMFECRQLAFRAKIQLHHMQAAALTANSSQARYVAAVTKNISYPALLVPGGGEARATAQGKKSANDPCKPTKPAHTKQDPVSPDRCVMIGAWD